MFCICLKDNIRRIMASYRKEWKEVDDQEKVVYILEAKQLNAKVFSIIFIHTHRVCVPFYINCVLCFVCSVFFHYIFGFVGPGVTMSFVSQHRLDVYFYYYYYYYY